MVPLHDGELCRVGAHGEAASEKLADHASPYELAFHLPDHSWTNSDSRGARRTLDSSSWVTRKCPLVQLRDERAYTPPVVPPTFRASPIPTNNDGGEVALDGPITEATAANYAERQRSFEGCPRRVVPSRSASRMWLSAAGHSSLSRGRRGLSRASHVDHAFHLFHQCITRDWAPQPKK
jgi:hypothetical protein